MRLKRSGGTRESTVAILAQKDGSIRVRVDDREIEAALEPMRDGTAILSIAGRRIRVAAALVRGSIKVAAGPLSDELVEVEERSARAGGRPAAPQVVAPMPGRVLKVLVAEGDRVSDGQPLVVLEAMKMETTLSAEGDAIIGRVSVAPGAMVDHGAVLMELKPAPATHRESAPRDR